MEKPTQTKRPGFWKRQFSSTITSRQDVFDMLAGAVIPILLLIFDPVVFRTPGGCVGATLGNYAFFAYFAIGLGAIALIAWLVAARTKQLVPSFMTGILLAGALFAAVVGIMMLPMSIPGLFVILGILGFFPFLTSFVYLRNAVRAYRIAKAVQTNQARRIITLLIAAVLVIGIPAATHIGISNVIQQSVNQILEEPDSPNSSATSTLKQTNMLCLGLCLPEITIAFQYAQEAHPERGNRLTAIYREITGQYLPSLNCGGE